MNKEIYDYYKDLGRLNDDGLVESESKVSMLREVLEDDACARQEDSTRVTRWVKIGEVARGSFARVYLWEKHSLDGGPPLQMAVKDSETSKFWQDYHAEGVLIRQLNESGCKNVITVLDWLYKPATPSREAFVRTCYEYAEHGDLEGLCKFYKSEQLLVPEAFIWHVYWSTANALCYCRHGTNKSDNTIPGWDTIVHGDVKPGNLLLTIPNDGSQDLYPTVKLGDFGTAYKLPESNVKLRAWKSTFQYGTRSFWAPEVETTNPKMNGTFGPIAASRMHGSHSDVWSLGALIEDLMNLRFHALKDDPDFDNPNLVDFYSPQLRKLTEACRRTRTDSRPAIYDVYLQTCEAISEWREAASAEASSIQSGRPFHSQVLFSKADRKRFVDDRSFRHAYRKVNRGPLLKKKTTPQAAKSVSKTAPWREEKQLLGARSIESLEHKVRAAWEAGDVSAADSGHGPLADSQSSAFILPHFGAPNAAIPLVATPGSPPTFAAPEQRSPQPPLAPTAFQPLERQVQPAWQTGNIPSLKILSADTAIQSAFRTPVQPYTRFSHKSPASPSAFSGQKAPTVPASLTGPLPALSIMEPSPRQAPPIPTSTKPRSNGSNKRRLQHESPEQQQQQPRRKVKVKVKASRFVEDLPEAKTLAVALGKRALTRTGALRRSTRNIPERRVMFDVDVDAVEG